MTVLDSPGARVWASSNPASPKAPHLRGFVFERGGRRVVAYWHTCGSGRASVAIGKDGSESVIDLGGLRYLETDLPRDAVRGAFVSAREFDFKGDAQ